MKAYWINGWSGVIPRTPFCRYADDGVVHCRTEKEVLKIKNRWGKPFINFSPAVSNEAVKSIQGTIRS
ncbi:MAG: hypothetical protein COS40_05790 [Deltaproteobacteria bacterium CG03_land_8_20_14_0_80_45_14]|nr:MAG: hypothetical protein COS40_05790 [Deltaproteobacteria bacterium CG03_land_8_20_14_0_80_45_14]